MTEQQVVAKLNMLYPRAKSPGVIPHHYPTINFSSWCKAAQVTRTTMARLLSNGGSTIKVATIARLATAAGLTIEDVLDFAERAATRYRKQSELSPKQRRHRKDPDAVLAVGMTLDEYVAKVKGS